VIQALSLPISAPVPEEYAKEFDAKNPSTYGQNVVFTGPYMVENDASGELVGYTPGKEIRMIRNPNWDGEATGDFRPAYLDSIQIDEGFADTASASRKILNGSASVNGDITPPPTVIQEAAESAEEGQMNAIASGGWRFVAFNTQEPPFDNIDLRKAFIAQANRTALRNTRGGELVGPVANHYIPPGMLGFEESGGLEAPGDLDFMANVDGDPDLAQQYMQDAGYESGQCEGDCQITVVGDGASPDKETTEVFVGTAEELGFEVEVRNVARDVMYTRFCNVPDQQPNVCPSVGWLKDFQDPQSMLQPTFSGDAIVASNNSNWPLLDVPEINSAIDEAVLVVDQQERAQAWADVNAQIVEQAPAIPYVWDNQVNIRSTDVSGVINTFNANWDLAFTSLTGG
jgi:peptide/nickel transport system substrate-binding protein